jgi:hypothetical protein
MTHTQLTLAVAARVSLLTLCGCFSSALSGSKSPFKANIPKANSEAQMVREHRDQSESPPGCA